MKKPPHIVITNNGDHVVVPEYLRRREAAEREAHTDETHLSDGQPWLDAVETGDYQSEEY